MFSATVMWLKSEYFWKTVLSGRLWAGSDVMTEYAKLTDFLSGYDALTPGWATARTEWWNMLQRVGNGGDVVLETDTLVENANAAAKE